MDTIHKTMKTKAAFLTIVALAAGSCVVAQSVEQDDMYFTAKDRAALNATHEAILTSQQAKRITESETTSTINPTDSYSARNVNPEYVSGSKVGSNTSAAAQYFTPNYQPTAVNQNLTSNCNCGYNSYSSRYGNAYSSYNPYGYSGFGSPYGYSSMYNSMMGYGSYGMLMSPFYGNSMYSSSLMFGFGSQGMNYGFGSYSGMNSFYGGYNPYAYNNGYRYGSPTIAVVDNPRVASSRNQEVDRYYSASGTRGRVETGSNGGRVATSGDQQYYNRTWRNDAQQMSRGTDTWNNTRSYQQDHNNSWNNSNNNWGSRNGDFGGSRGINSGGGFSGGGAAGSGGAAVSGSGGGGRRGRD